MTFLEHMNLDLIHPKTNFGCLEDVKFYVGLAYNVVATSSIECDNFLQSKWNHYWS